jgi:hypothetical protein
MDPGGPKNADPADLVSDPQHCRRLSESRKKLPEEGLGRILRKLISTKRQSQNAKSFSDHAETDNFIFLNFQQNLPATLSLYCGIGPDPNFLPDPYKIIPDQE